MPLPSSYNSFIPQNQNFREEDFYYGTQTSPNQYKTLSNTIAFATSIAITHKIGTTRFGAKRGYDYIVGGIRAIEEFSPAKIFRTFQVSHMMSPLETASRSTRYFSPELISRLDTSPAGRGWLRYLSELTGKG